MVGPKDSVPEGNGVFCVDATGLYFIFVSFPNIEKGLLDEKAYRC